MLTFWEEADARLRAGSYALVYPVVKFLQQQPAASKFVKKHPHVACAGTGWACYCLWLIHSDGGCAGHAASRQKHTQTLCLCHVAFRQLGIRLE